MAIHPLPLRLNLGRVAARFLVATTRGAGVACAWGCWSIRCSSIAYSLERAVLCEGGGELLGEVDGNTCGEVLCDEVGGGKSLGSRQRLRLLPCVLRTSP